MGPLFRTLTRNYARFSGRASRSEYFWFAVFAGLVQFTLWVTDLAADDGEILSKVADLALLLPFTALTVRRLHDTGRSGWWLLLNVVPLAGQFVLAIWMALRGETGSNWYGEDPLAEYRWETR
jgi:uncharacterized membrane protein YhaH (DUF805 family)